MRWNLPLTPVQWKTLSSAFSNVSQAIILFALAAFFVPQTVNLPTNFSGEFAVLTFINGLLILGIAVILSKKEK